jgi:hypothetical protein
MATWVEDIVQALENLGGRAPLSQIYAEVKRIRKEPLPRTYTASIRERIESHSSDSKSFKGKDIFKKVDRGVWALRDHETTANVASQHQKIAPLSFQDYSVPESYEDISNRLRTIKQYRDFQKPGETTWKEYIKEIFHILGFSTFDLSPRLILLTEISLQETPLGLIVYVEPTENIIEVVPGLLWESFMMFAAHYYNIDWGIITNGLQLKVVNYSDNELKQPLFWPDLDNVILSGQQDTFFSIFKLFSYIKHGKSLRINKNIHDQNTLIKDGDLTETETLRLQFWSKLLEKSNKKTSAYQNISPSKGGWISTGAGKSGLNYAYVVRKHDAQVEFYIDLLDKDLNKKRFQFFLNNKHNIERQFGAPLDWQLLPDKRASRIRYIITGYGLRDEANWDKLHDKLINAMIRLTGSLKPYIHQID